MLKRLKASLPCVTVQGPTGPYEVLRSESIPTLFALENTIGWQFILGDVAGLHRLAFFARLAATRRDTVVHLPLRSNRFPEELAREAKPAQAFDLVLAPRHVALRPKEWKAIRAWKPTQRRRVVLPPLPTIERYPETRIPYERLDRRGMDRQNGASTLILSGDPATFDGLAEFAVWASLMGDNWGGTHLDRIMRNGDIGLLIKFWDAKRVPEHPLE